MVFTVLTSTLQKRKHQTLVLKVLKATMEIHKKDWKEAIVQCFLLWSLSIKDKTSDNITSKEGKMLLETVFLTFLVASVSSNPWTEERANIIRDKFLFMWQNIEVISKDFDERYNGPYKGYLWDPLRVTYERNCNAEDSLCKQWYDEYGDRYNGRLQR